MKFNKLINEAENKLKPDWDPRKLDTGDNNEGSWSYLSNYNPEVNIGVEKDPEVKELGKINHAQYKYLIETGYQLKKPLLVFGKPGIGKSVAVREALLSLAKKTPKTDKSGMREPVFFHSIDTKTQEDVLKNPGNYFVLVDVRLATLEPSDFIGIPLFNKNEDSRITRDKSETDFLKTVLYKWTYLVTQPEAAGFLFFDEVNQGEDEILNAMYQVIQNKQIFDKPISKDISIFAAGNLAYQDPVAQNKPLNKALSRRFNRGICTLVVEPDEWLKWAYKQRIHPSILAFINSNKKNNFYRTSDQKNNRMPDPDSITTVSKHLYNIERKFYKRMQGTKQFNYSALIKEYDRITRAIVGAEWANDFIKFLQENSVETFKDDPSKLTPQQKWLNIHTAQQAYSYLLSTDPTLKNKESRGQIKFLNNWLKAQPADVKQSLSDNLLNSELSEQFKELKIVLDTTDLKDVKESEELIMDISSGKYTSEFKPYSNEQETTNLLTVNHEQLGDSLDNAWDTKDSLLIYGDPGIGKSWAVRKIAEQKAKELKLIFAPVNELNEKERIDLINTPTNYFLFVDIRASYLEPVDLVGIPQMVHSTGSPKWLVTQKFFWAWIITQPKVKGILFFDEINQAKPQVLKGMYSIIDPAEKRLFDTKISNDILIVGAGNLPSQESASAQKSDISNALTRRFKAGTIVLKLDADEWIKWAITQKGTPNEIHPMVIKFIASRENPENYIFRRTESEETADMTPDTLKSLSENLRLVERRFDERKKEGIDIRENEKQFRDELHTEVTVTLTSWADEFLNFIFMYRNMNWADIMKDREIYSDPRKLRQQGAEGQSKLSKLLAFIPASVDVIRNILKNDKELKMPKTRETVNELLDFFAILNKTFGATYLTYMKRLGETETLQYFLTQILNNQTGIDETIRLRAKQTFTQIKQFVQQ